MADDLHYVHGDFYRIDDRSGFKVRARRTRKEWTNLIVDRKIWEERHPQDFVKGVVDNQSVPDSRPRETLDVFLGSLQTTTTASVAAGGNIIPLTSAVRFLVGDTVQIMLDTNVYFSTVVQQVLSLTSIRISPALAYSAAAGNFVTNLSAIASVNIG